MTIDDTIRWRAQEGVGYLSPDQKRNLARLTAAYDSEADRVDWQLIVFDGADEDGIEEYSCIATDVIADFQTATIHETLIRVRNAEEAKLLRPLAITIFEAEAS